MMTVCLVLLWLLIIAHLAGSLVSLCHAVHYRDIMVELDADRIAHQPFQPKISVVIRCDLSATSDPVSKIREAISLNYTRYEVIVIADSACGTGDFGEIVRYFDLESRPVPESLGKLWSPTRNFYRSPNSLYKRLTVIDKPFRDWDDLRYTGASVCQADYMLFIRSLDNVLRRNSLASLAILKMRSAEGHVATIRSTARYDCSGSFFGNFFRMLADLCNLRRIYVSGACPGDDYGQFVILEDISGRRGREEQVPRPQMYLRRPNRLGTYLNQLAPDIRYNSPVGKMIYYMEWLVSLFYWASVVLLLSGGGDRQERGFFMLTALMLPLLSSTFSIFIGEILVKREFRLRFVLRLLLLAYPETLLFCILLPWVRVVTWFRRRLRRSSSGG